MLIKQVDHIDSESLETPIACTAHVGRGAVRGTSLGRLVDLESELGCYDDAVARNVTEETPNQLLVCVRSVNFGCIQEVTSEFHVTAKHSKRFCFIAWSVSPGHAHAA